MINNEKILSEIIKLLASLPDNLSDDRGLDWLGQARFLFTKSDDPMLVARISTVVQNATDPMRLKGMGARAELIVLISQLKKEFELKCGYSISRNYDVFSDTDKDALKISVEEFQNVVEGDNELDADSKDILIGEIAVLEATLAAPRVSTELMNRFVTAILKGTIVSAAGTLVTTTLDFQL